MAKVGGTDLKEPLMGNTAAKDVESGDKEPPPPTKEELDDELKKGTMSCGELIAFFMDPSHWIVTALVAYTGCVGLGLIEYEVLEHTQLSYMIQVSCIAVAGLGSAAYTAFLAEQLKEEVNKFRKLNSKLEMNRDRLEGTAKELRENVDRMHNEVDQLAQVKEQMKAYADQVGGGFKDVLANAMDSLESMKKLQLENVSEILSQVAQNLEMMDDEEGMTKEEYEKFLARIPDNVRGMKEIQFEAVAKDGATASFDDVQGAIDKVMASIKSQQPPSSSTATKV